jgi:hypothetical protein
MDFNLLLCQAFMVFSTLFTLLFLLQRARYRRKKRQGKRPGFSPSTAALGLALLSLQTLVQPDLHHSIEQRQADPAEEDDEGDPDDPAAQLTRQLKRIRNGQPIDTLKVPLSERS